MAASSVLKGEECPVCYSVGEVERLSPCGHGLCPACVQKLEQFAALQGRERRCPLCRQVFLVLQRPKGLVEICVKRLEWRLPRAHELPRLTPQLRVRFLFNMKNRRLLYGDVLHELIRGLQLDELPLQDASNLSSKDICAIVPLLAEPYPKVVTLRNVPLLDDGALGNLLGHLSPRLEHLDTSSAEERLEGLCLEDFAGSMPRLSTLVMADCHHIVSAPIEALAAGCARSLKVVDLSGCRKLGNEVVCRLAECRGLRRLSVRGFWKLETQAVVELLQSCVILQFLDLTFCSRVSGPEVFRAIAGYSTELRELLVGSVAAIDDDAVLALALSTAGASIQNLSLSRSEITGKSLKAIRMHCPNLRRLDVSDCHDISEDAVVSAITEMPQLRILQLKYCRGISTSMQLYVAQLLAGRSLGIEDAAPLKRTSTGFAPTSPTARPRRGSLDDDDCCCAGKDRRSDSSTTAASSGSQSSSSSSSPAHSSTSPSSSSTAPCSPTPAFASSSSSPASSSSSHGAMGVAASSSEASCHRLSAELSSPSGGGRSQVTSLSGAAGSAEATASASSSRRATRVLATSSLGQSTDGLQLPIARAQTLDQPEPEPEHSGLGAATGSPRLQVAAPSSPARSSTSRAIPVSSCSSAPVEPGPEGPRRPSVPTSPTSPSASSSGGHAATSAASGSGGSGSASVSGSSSSSGLPARSLARGTSRSLSSVASASASTLRAPHRSETTAAERPGGGERAPLGGRRSASAAASKAGLAAKAAASPSAAGAEGAAASPPSAAASGRRPLERTTLRSTGAAVSRGSGAQELRSSLRPR